MARAIWWASGATRRVPLPVSGGTAVIFAPPHRAGGAIAMSSTYATVNRAVGDTTLTLSATANWNSAEAWATLRVTANRLIGLYIFTPSGRKHRITAQTVGAALTFTPALAEALTAEVTEIRIQSDLPPILSYLMLKSTTQSIRWVYAKANTLATDYSTLVVPQAELIFDTDHSVGGMPVKGSLYMVSDDAAAATTAEIEAYAA